MEKISIQELAAVLTIKNGLKKKEAEQFVTMIFEVVKDNLMSERQIKIKGLGTFKIVEIEARESINVNTGERVLIEGHEKISFTPDTAMKELVNRPFSQFETVILNDGVDFDNVNDVPVVVEQETGDEVEELESIDVEEPVIELVEEVVESPVEEPVEAPAEEVVEAPAEEPMVTFIGENEVPVMEAPEVPAEIVEAEEEMVVEEAPIEPETTTEEIVDPVYLEFMGAIIEEEPVDGEIVEAVNEPPVEIVEEKPIKIVDEKPAEIIPEKPAKVFVEEPADTIEEESSETVDEEDTEIIYDDEEKGKGHFGRTLIWVCLALVACALSFFAGYRYGRSHVGIGLEVITDAVQVVDEDTVAVADTVKADTIEAVAPEVASTPEAAPAPEVKPATPQVQEQPTKPAAVVASATADDDYKKYERMDARVRTGAYRIVGTAQEVTVKEGETLKLLARRHLGPDMECYIEVYNGINANTELKAGQRLKIPKLQWKVKRTTPGN